MAAHEFLNPEGMSPPVGFSHVAVAAPGRLVFVAGQTAHQADGSLAGATLAEQFAAAAENVAAALAAAGATPADLVQLHIYTTDVDGYRAGSKAIGAAYRTVFGPHYPPMALFGVTRLYDAAALVELVATAVIADPEHDLS
ncbi:MAG TPA: Rid family hydrolase [Acidimicrobiia bacterium]|nr:Rid family hydrolase [Acidimicrobiia bacterium]